jgi:hypothetical protein
MEMASVLDVLCTVGHQWAVHDVNQLVSTNISASSGNIVLGSGENCLIFVKIISDYAQMHHIHAFLIKAKNKRSRNYYYLRP